MMGMTTTAGDHLIEIEFSIWSGLEQIKCDDVVVSEKKSWFYTTPHFFVLQEAGEEVTYEDIEDSPISYINARPVAAA